MCTLWEALLHIVLTPGPKMLEAMPYGMLLILTANERDLLMVLHWELNAPNQDVSHVT